MNTRSMVGTRSYRYHLYEAMSLCLALIAGLSLPGCDSEDAPEVLPAADQSERNALACTFASRADRPDGPRIPVIGSPGGIRFLWCGGCRGVDDFRLRAEGAYGWLLGRGGRMAVTIGYIGPSANVEEFDVGYSREEPPPDGRSGFEPEHVLDITLPMDFDRMVRRMDVVYVAGRRECSGAYDFRVGETAIGLLNRCCSVGRSTKERPGIGGTLLILRRFAPENYRSYGLLCSQPYEKCEGVDLRPSDLVVLGEWKQSKGCSIEITGEVLQPTWVQCQPPGSSIKARAFLLQTAANGPVFELRPGAPDVPFGVTLWGGRHPDTGGPKVLFVPPWRGEAMNEGDMNGGEVGDVAPVQP